MTGSRHNIDVVDWPISGILDHSVAGRHSEEGFTAFADPGLYILRLDGQFGHNFILFLVTFEVVEDLLFFNLSVFQEHIQCRLT